MLPPGNSYATSRPRPSPRRVGGGQIVTETAGARPFDWRSAVPTLVGLYIERDVEFRYTQLAKSREQHC